MKSDPLGPVAVRTIYREVALRDMRASYRSKFPQRWAPSHEHTESDEPFLAVHFARIRALWERHDALVSAQKLALSQLYVCRCDSCYTCGVRDVLSSIPLDSEDWVYGPA